MPKQSCLLAAVWWLATAAATASAAVGSSAAFASQPADAAPCVSQAAEHHGVNPWIVRAILKVESDFNPRAVNKNANGTVDVGMAQINSIHFAELSKFGIAPDALMDGCVATYVAAWHLAKQVRKHGYTWFGVASYHSASPCQNSRYAGLLWNTLLGWGVVSGARVKVPSLAACGYRAPTESRSSRASAGSRSSPAMAFDEGQP